MPAVLFASQPARVTSSNDVTAAKAGLCVAGRCGGEDVDNEITPTERQATD